MRWIVLLLFLALITGGAYQGGTARPDHRTALAGQTPDATPASPLLPRRIYAAGAVEGTQRDVPLRFEIAGRLQSLAVQEGDQVAAGDVLAQLAPEVWELKLAEALARLTLSQAERERLVNGASPESRAVLKSEIQSAEVAVREAEAHLGRGLQLAERHALSTQELDDYRYKFEKATTQLRSVRARSEELEAPVRQDDLSVAEAKVALAEASAAHERTMLEKTRLRAPTSGVVLEVRVEAGELVGPNDEHHTLTLVNRDATRVRAFVEELDAPHVAPGQRAVVTADGLPGKQFAGIVKSCAPSVHPKSQRHLKAGEMLDLKIREVLIELDDADGLVIGLPVDVFIHPQH